MTCQTHVALFVQKWSRISATYYFACICLLFFAMFVCVANLCWNIWLVCQHALRFFSNYAWNMLFSSFIRDPTFGPSVISHVIVFFEVLLGVADFCCHVWLVKKIMNFYNSYKSDMIFRWTKRDRAFAPNIILHVDCVFL